MTSSVEIFFALITSPIENLFCSHYTSWCDWRKQNSFVASSGILQNVALIAQLGARKKKSVSCYSMVGMVVVVDIFLSNERPAIGIVVLATSNPHQVFWGNDKLLSTTWTDSTLKSNHGWHEVDDIIIVHFYPFSNAPLGWSMHYWVGTPVDCIAI